MHFRRCPEARKHRGLEYPEKEEINKVPASIFIFFHVLILKKLAAARTWRSNEH